MIPAEFATIIAAIDAEDDALKARLRRPEAFAEAAAWYGSQGIACFPLIPGGKRPATAHGLHDATVDPDRIRAWWRTHPDANIGLRTGLSFDVIDVDGPLGYRSLAKLRLEGLVPEIIGRTITARGGTHLFIHPTGDGNTAGLRPGIDVRGRGGFVVAPPSLSSTTGRRWIWVTPLVTQSNRSPGDAE